MKYLAILIPIVLWALSGCYYDNEEDLYPVAPDCDSLNVSYATTIVPLLQQHCTGCHSGGSPSGGVALVEHADVQVWAQNGALYGSMAHIDGFSPMPSSTLRLPDCDLGQVKNWVEAGALNN
ncbi:MAG: hypothetical protein AAF927_09070 [Bacteroidota bacterium]